jgi:hypothetical protein
VELTHDDDEEEEHQPPHQQIKKQERYGPQILIYSKKLNRNLLRKGPTDKAYPPPTYPIRK